MYAKRQGLKNGFIRKEIKKGNLVPEKYSKREIRISETEYVNYRLKAKERGGKCIYGN